MSKLNSWFVVDFKNEQPYRFSLNGPKSTFVSFYKNFKSYMAFINSMEATYGTIFMYTGLDRVAGATACEVPDGARAKFLEEWREWFKDKGFDVGEVHTYDRDSEFTTDQQKEYKHFCKAQEQIQQEAYS